MSCVCCPFLVRRRGASPLRWSLRQESGLRMVPSLCSRTIMLRYTTLRGGLKLGGGVGVRFAKPVTTLSKNNYYDSTHYDNEVDLPLFVRISYGKSRLTASLDAGYAFGLWSVYSKEAIPGGNRKPTYRGLFLEPQLGLRIGKDSVLSLGVLLQQTTDVLNLDNVLTPAATLRYSYYF